MRERHGAIAVFFSALLMLSGCSSAADASNGTRAERAEAHAFARESGPEPSAASPQGSEITDTQAQPPADDVDAEQAAGPSYISRLARQTAAKFTQPGMSEYERAKGAFDYMIATTNLTEPVGLNLWRIRDAGEKRPSYVENRSLSVLLYGIGMCEDYAAAFTMLLRGAGLEAEYVPGLTYSAEGALVDHAWTMARIDGVWYHLDCQLEDNISRHGAIRYRYFMKGDATMAGSHRWGRNLIDSGLLTTAQNEEIARDYLMPQCPQDYPTPPRQAFTAVEMPDMEAIRAGIEAEFREYESANGPLEPLELDIIPPVFALEGYGPPD